MRARPVHKWRTYLITRRCSDRRFFLRPCETTNQILMYLLGKAASRFQLQLHGWVVMSNHIHIVLTDIAGQLPDAMHWLMLQTSKGVGAEIGRWGGFWDNNRYSRVELLDRNSAISKLVYTLANPVSARLVRRAHRWPGATSAAFRFGETRTIPPPKTEYFSGDKWQEPARLTVLPPPGMTAADATAVVQRRVQRRETAVARLMRQQGGGRFLGEKRVLRQDPFDCPTSWEKRRGRNPTFASGDRWRRVEAAQRKRGWQAEYREALAAYRRGEPNVQFPAGTWAMVKLYGCRCAPPARI
ncbi:MAG: hypothetical protein AAF721_24455 [Myxococcota bacterium]